MARELELEATHLRSAADDYEEDRARDAALQRRWKDIQHAALRIAGGGDVEAEAARLATLYGADFGSSTAHDFRRILMDQQSHARAVVTFRRNREVMMLARKGWTNDEIASYLPRLGFAKLNPKSVSRIIQGCLHGKL
jgi:hypothetical protein